MLKNYRLSFEIFGLFLFLIIMIPNFIYFVFSTPHDIFQANSITKNIDKTAFSSLFFDFYV